MDDVMAAGQKQTLAPPIPHLSAVDKEAFKECVYYLEKYGPKKMGIALYVRHNMLPTALKFCIDHQVEADVFVEEIIQVYAMQNSLDELKAQISKTGTHKSSFLFTLSLI